MSLKRAIQNWSLEYVDVVRSPGSAVRVFTSSERLANQLKINEITEVGEQVMKTETNAPKIGKLVRKNEMGDPRVGELVKKNQMDVPRVGKSSGGWKIGEEDRDGRSTSKKITKKVETGDRKVGELVKKI